MSRVSTGGAGAGAGPEAALAAVTAVEVSEERTRSGWREVSSARSRKHPHRRSGAASVVVGDSLYLFGGYGGDGRLDDSWMYNWEKRTWKRLEYTTPSPGERENNGIVEHDGKLYLFGGYNGSEWLNDFHEFDIETRAWREIKPEGDAPASRFGYVSMTHGDVFLLFGGYDGSAWLNDLYEFTFSTETWRRVDPTGSIPSIRSCPAWTKHGTSVFVFGGYDGLQRMNDFYEFRLDTYHWELIATSGTPPSPRYFHSCAYYGNSFYVFGGYDGSVRLNDFHEFNFATRQWRCICEPSKHDPEDDVWNRSSPMPSGRSSLIAQVYKHSLYCFGGYNGSTVLNDFYEYRFEPVMIPQSTLKSDLRTLLNRQELSDVTFIVEGKPIYASRVHLALRCETFRAMFFGGLKESRTGGDIEMPGISYTVFLKLLEFIYTDEVAEIDSDVAVGLLVAAEQFLLGRLKSLCELAIQKSISTSNVIQHLLEAHQHHAEDLKELCLEYIQDNFEVVKEHESFELLKHEPELLFALLLRQPGMGSGMLGGGSASGSSTPRSGHGAVGGGGSAAGAGAGSAAPTSGARRPQVLAHSASIDGGLTRAPIGVRPPPIPVVPAAAADPPASTDSEDEFYDDNE